MFTPGRTDQIPKNDRPLLLWLALGVLAIGMLVLMVVGFVDAGTVTHEEIEGSPEATPRTLAE